MPIGDLLAEISGDPSSPKPTTGIKRKADNDSTGPSVKAIKPRHSDGTAASSNAKTHNGNSVNSSRPVARPSYAAAASDKRPGATKPSSSADPPQARMARQNTNGRPVSGGNRMSGAAGSGAGNSVAGSKMSRPSSSISSLVGAQRAPPSKTPAAATSVDPSRAPKKGSFAEIMARGAKAQQSMGKVGVIQHKAIDKPMTKKEREAAKSEQKAGAKATPGKSYSGSSRAAGSVAKDGSRAAAPSKSGTAKKETKAAAQNRRPGSSGEEEPVKRIKKSATATTGYSGTARPQVGAPSKKSGPGASNGARPNPQRAGGLLAPPRTGRRDRYEEEDEDMDDFIDDDEDEEELDPYGYGRRYAYAASDASSDMEAGMSDIDGEERRAERAAREEDKREQALEERLRREKEERKRQYAHGYR